MAAAAAIVTGANDAATVGSSLGAAAMQEDTSKYQIDAQTKIAQQQIDFSKAGIKSFTDVGIPAFFGYSHMDLPMTNIHEAGNSFSQSIGVNSNLPFYHGDSYYPQMFGTGKPNPSVVGSSKAAPTYPGLGYNFVGYDHSHEPSKSPSADLKSVYRGGIEYSDQSTSATFTQFKGLPGFYPSMKETGIADTLDSGGTRSFGTNLTYFDQSPTKATARASQFKK